MALSNMRVAEVPSHVAAAARAVAPLPVAPVHHAPPVRLVLAVPSPAADACPPQQPQYEVLEVMPEDEIRVRREGGGLWEARPRAARLAHARCRIARRAADGARARMAAAQPAAPGNLQPAAAACAPRAPRRLRRPLPAAALTPPSPPARRRT
jgi:hypothetical protein